MNRVYQRAGPELIRLKGLLPRPAQRLMCVGVELATVEGLAGPDLLPLSPALPQQTEGAVVPGPGLKYGEGGHITGLPLRSQEIFARSSTCRGLSHRRHAVNNDRL